AVYVKGESLERTLSVVLNMFCCDLVSLIIDFYKKHATRFAVLRNVRHLDRAGIECPVLDLVMHMRMAETHVIGNRFELQKSGHRKRRDRMRLMSLDIRVQKQNVKSSFASIFFYCFGQHRYRPIRRRTVPV